MFTVLSSLISDVSQPVEVSAGETIMLVLVPAVVCLLIKGSESQLICPYCNPNYGETRVELCSHDVATPVLLCHKEPAQGTQSPLLGALGRNAPY